MERGRVHGLPIILRRLFQVNSASSRPILACLFFLGAFLSPAHASSQALIVVGASGTPAIRDELNETAQGLRDAFIKRGLAAAEVRLMVPAEGKKISKEGILAQLKTYEKTGAQDELWLVLLGFSGRDGEGKPAFQVSGPRLAAADLKSALDSVPARQFVFVGTSDSGGFVPLLLKKGREVFAATKDQGEIDLPRLPRHWLQALSENPQASWVELAALAAKSTEAEYDAQSLAIGEHARLGDPETGRVLQAPFDLPKVAVPSDKPLPGGPMELISAADIKIEIRDPNAEWENQPATPETRKLIAEARAVPNPEEFNSIILEQKLSYTVREDRSAENSVLRRIYIAREDGVERWANLLLPQDPPVITTKLLAARVIRPDGSSTVFNPAKLPTATDCSSGLCGALTMVFLPNVHAGSVVEFSYRTQQILNASTPQFSQNLEIQGDSPVLLGQVQLRVPANGKIHFRLRNDESKPEETKTGGDRVLTWKFKNMAAFEPLPYDPPVRAALINLEVSSLESWDDFAAWFRRIAKGSDLPDEAVKKKASELAAGSKTRLEKIRKTYEFVSAFRYVAIEFGINGFRPRTPATVLQNRYGDCKDKANLLSALLREMGIDSRLALLNRGSTTDPEFPSWQFNHAIAFVPKAPADGQAGDLWLDSTDSTAPFPTVPPGDLGCSALVFGKDTAEFKTVAMSDEEITRVTNLWRFQQGNDGAWTGTQESSWSGNAEYGIRRQLRGLSPRQRDFQLQGMLSEQLARADFSEVKVTPVDDLSIPVAATGKVASAALPLPNFPFDVNTYFSSTTRNRPLVMDNGHKFQYTQTVEWSYKEGAPASLPPPFKAESAGIRVSVEWSSAGGKSVRRVAALEVDQPTVASSDYVPVRKMLHGWLAAFKN